MLEARVLIEAFLHRRELVAFGSAVSCVRTACVRRRSVHTRLANLTHCKLEIYVAP